MSGCVGILQRLSKPSETHQFIRDRKPLTRKPKTLRRSSTSIRFSALLRTAREDAGLDHKGLANLADCSVPSVERAEGGKAAVSRRIAEAICKALSEKPQRDVSI